MSFAEALIWLVQNPESVLLRGNRQPLALNRARMLCQLTEHGPRYARISIGDIVAADWQGMAIDAFVQQVNQRAAEG